MGYRGRGRKISLWHLVLLFIVKVGIGKRGPGRISGSEVAARAWCSLGFYGIVLAPDQNELLALGHRYCIQAAGGHHALAWVLWTLERVKSGPMSRAGH